MPRSSGTYTLPAGNPVVTGTTITSTWANTTFSDVATALTNSVPTDGSAPMVGALQMGNNKITGVTDGTASSDVATVNQISNPTITGGTIDGAPIGAANPKNGAFLALTATSAGLTGTCTAPTVTPSTDSSTKIATTAFVQSAITAVSSGVTSFNTRSGAVTLSSGDVTTALGYTPYNASGATVVTTSNISSYAPTVSGSGAYGTWGISISGNAATATTATNATGLSGSPTITVTQVNTGSINTTGSTLSFNISGTPYVALNNVPYFFPNTDNFISLGAGGNRWSVVFAATGTINTSDANDKQQIQDLTAAEKAVGQALKGMMKSFKFNDSVQEKGANARIHFGVIAQDVKTAFEAQGLTAENYGVFCSDTWYEVDGKSCNANGEMYTSSSPNAVEKTRLGVRYDELFALILGAM